jgi:aryl-alcohol dehydrogenase-like predicted oxidoreductase
VTLATVPFGRTDMRTTRLGFGAWAAGGGGWASGWGPQDDDTSIAAMKRALAGGVNWIDTAGVYGHGHSEEIVGRLLRELTPADRPLVFTKGGPVWDPASPMEDAVSDLRPEVIRAQCDDSLRRLGVERLDLYQFHWPDEGTVSIEDSWAEMVRLIEAGKVRAGGLSNYSVPELDRCESIRHVDSLQPPLSLIRRRAAGDVIPWCAAHGTAVIVYSPMQAGLLTDTFTAARMSQLPQDDWRRQSREFQEPKLTQNLKLRDALRPVAQRHGTTVAAVSVAWTLAWPGVTGTIVGARGPEQVAGWLPAASLTLTDQDLDDIEQAIASTGAGHGPARPRTTG